MEDKKKRLDAIKKTIYESEYVPTGDSIVRAVVAGIPIVGGALDHLLFDKAEEIKFKNVEQAIKDIGDKIESLAKSKIDKEWFGSTEALEMFRQLIEKVQFESDQNKIKTIANIYAVSGTKEFSSDPNKFAVLRIASELTTVQKEVLLAIHFTPVRERKFSDATFGWKGSAIWFDDINDTIIRRPRFTSEVIRLYDEVDIIQSFFLIRKVNVPVKSIGGYHLTVLGNLLVNYLKQ